MTTAIAQYHRPKSLEQAFELALAQPEARYVAGGTDIIVKLRERRASAPALISLRGIDALRGASSVAGGVTRIGALSTIAELLDSALLAERFPVLLAAARRLGSVQIRNAATLGGNLCNASPCADTAPPLLVHDARVEIAGPEGTREEPLDSFFVAPGETRLGPGEIVAAVLLDPPAEGARAVFFKKGRVAMDLSLASVAALVEIDSGSGQSAVCARARLAAGSVAKRPLRLHELEASLVGATLDDETIARARAAASAEISPIDDVRTTAAYRRQLVGVFVERALRQLRDGAAPRGGGQR